MQGDIETNRRKSDGEVIHTLLHVECGPCKERKSTQQKKLLAALACGFATSLFAFLAEAALANSITFQSYLLKSIFGITLFQSSLRYKAL